MGTIILIILLAAGVGAVFGLFSGEKGGVATGAIGGAYMAGSCLFQLVMIGLMVVAGIWVLSLIF
jgi:hypothetical protein